MTEFTEGGALALLANEEGYGSSTLPGVIFGCCASANTKNQ